MHRLVVLMVAVGFAIPAQSQDMRSQLRALQAEPTVRETQEAALRYFKINQDSVASMRTRAGWKAILPVTEVSGGFAKSTADEDTENRALLAAGDTWVLRNANGTGLDIRGKLTWNLPQLIFNAEELDVASLAGLMEGILKESTRLYFMRRRLQVDMILTPPTDQASLLTKQLRLEELTGLIDAMTGGWFQQELTRRGTGVKNQHLQLPEKAAAPRAEVPPRAAPPPKTVLRRRAIEE